MRLTEHQDKAKANLEFENARRQTKFKEEKYEIFLF